MRYEDFRLQIAPGPAGGYTVHAQSPRGEGRELFVPPAFQAGTGPFGAGFWRGTRTERHLSIDGGGKPGPSLEAVGDRLFEALFPGKILRLYERSLDVLEGDPTAGLRIKLMFDPSNPDLVPVQELPWELLRQPGTPDFLALSRRRPVIRYLEIPRPVYAVPRPQPFRIVVVASSPDQAELGDLDLARELDNLQTAVTSGGRNQNPRAAD